MMMIKKFGQSTDDRIGSLTELDVVSLFITTIWNLPRGLILKRLFVRESGHAWVILNSSEVHRRKWRHRLRMMHWWRHNESSVLRQILAAMTCSLFRHRNSWFGEIQTLISDFQSPRPHWTQVHIATNFGFCLKVSQVSIGNSSPNTWLTRRAYTQKLLRKQLPGFFRISMQWPLRIVGMLIFCLQWTSCKPFSESLRQKYAYKFIHYSYV